MKHDAVLFRFGKVSIKRRHMRRAGFLLGVLLPSSALIMPVEMRAATHVKAKKEASVSPSSVSIKKAQNLPRKKHLVSQDPEAVSVSAHRTIAHNTENVVSRVVMEQQVAGTNPLRALGQTPGVSFSSTDALGLDTWGTSIYVRGFFQDSLGLTLDGIPLNSQAYTTLNGLNVNNAVISDDIDRIQASQGAGNLELPSNTNLGGSLQFFTRDPAKKFGGKISQGFGSWGMKRTFVRIDSGELNESGTKFYVDYSRAYEKKFDASSPMFMQQTDGKLVQPIGHASKMTAYFNWSDAQVWGYADKSQSILDNAGWRTESFYPNYAGAYAAAQWNWVCDGSSASCATPAYATNPITGKSLALRGPSSIPSSWLNTNETAGTAYYDAGQRTIDYLGGLKFDLELTNHLRWNTTFYGHSDTSYATYGDPYVPSVTGAPLSEQVWQYRQERFGFNTDFLYRIAHHLINVGFWYENNNNWAGQFWYNEPVLGEGAALKTVGPYNTYGPAFAQNYGFQWNTNTFQAHVMDTWSPLENLKVTYGFKSMLQTTSGGANFFNTQSYDDTLPTYDNLPNGSITSSRAFLPHLNIDWRFLRHHELYIDIAENFRPFTVAPTGGSVSPWAVSAPAGSSVTSQDLFNQIRRTTKPEHDWIYLIGYRYNSNLISASVDAYHADVRHRLISASVGSLNDPQTSVIDSKKAGIYGMDASVTLRPIRGLEVTNSVSYNHFTYGSNVNICPTEEYSCNIKGKKMTGYPSVMYKTNASYTWKKLNVHFSANYYSKRPFSYMNDQYVRSYWLAETGARYTFGDYGVLKNLQVSFNVYNLFNAKYIAMMGENGFPISGDYQSMERGVPRQYFGTVSTEF
ncbi:MAG: TonB-dependent receptor [Acetobacter sp.]